LEIPAEQKIKQNLNSQEQQQRQIKMPELFIHITAY